MVLRTTCKFVSENALEFTNTIVECQILFFGYSQTPFKRRKLREILGRYKKGRTLGRRIRKREERTKGKWRGKETGEAPEEASIKNDSQFSQLGSYDRK
jgi:hypothetical protein